MISTHGKACILISDNSKEAQALLSSSHNQRPDKSPTEEDHEQAGGCWTNNPVGS